ncbi:MAG: hypothetical protein RIR53_1518 [Bacteroidota bacterium]
MTNPAAADARPWYATWFESPWYMELYRHRGDDEARQVVQLIDHTMHIPHGAQILDLCCGFGRHTVALAERGYVTTGLDYSEYLIAHARRYNAHDNARYVVGDIRGPYPSNSYALIANLFTSFGYFDDHSQHLAALSAVERHLAADGRFVMDFFNADVLRRTLVPESMTMIGQTTVIQERWIEEHFVCKRITINDPCSSEHTFEERVWLYSPEDLRQMMTQVGLSPIRAFGSYHGETFQPDVSTRIILIAEKAAT